LLPMLGGKVHDLFLSLKKGGRNPRKPLAQAISQSP